MPKYYPINEEAARRAKNANSFSDYVPGSATAAYREMVDRAYALGEQQKGRVDPMYHEKIDGLIDRYARKLAENTPLFPHIFPLLAAVGFLCTGRRAVRLPPVRGNRPAAYRAYLKIRPWALAHKGRFQRRIKGQDGLPEIAAV